MVSFYCRGQPSFNVTVTITHLIYFLFSDKCCSCWIKWKSFYEIALMFTECADTDVQGRGRCGQACRVGTVIRLTDSDNWAHMLLSTVPVNLINLRGITIEHHNIGTVTCPDNLCSTTTMCGLSRSSNKVWTGYGMSGWGQQGELHLSLHVIMSPHICYKIRMLSPNS